MRLIDADNAMKAFAVEYKETKELIDSGEAHLDNLAEWFTEAAHIIKYIATIVDAVPVVRCKDCYQSVVIGEVLHCTYWRKNTDENGYCHEGG